MKNKSLRRIAVILALLLQNGLWYSEWAHSQVVADGAVYKSEADELLTLQTVSVLPFSDNVQGIYARPLESHLNDLLNKIHRFDLLPANMVGPILSPEELQDDLEKSKQVAAGLTSDAFFVVRISKGPNGINMVMSLFLKKDGQLLFTESLKDSPRFDLADLKEQIEQLLHKIIAKIPYQGRVLSRDNQRVTINIGSQDGLQAGQTLSVIQIISMTRHPKFNFLLSSEKEVLGKIKILKVDDTLSFGTLISEKERGVVRKNAKIMKIDFVSYGDPKSLDDTNGEGDLKERPDQQVSFGDNPKSWVPTASPTFGQVGARLGNSFYNANTTLTGVGALESSSYLAPSVFLDGEIWLTSHISIQAGFRQGIIPIDNPRSQASPKKLNQSLMSYDFMFGYNFRFSPSIWGAHLEVLLGYMNTRFYADASTPEAYTTMTYSGLKTGLKGDFPVTSDRIWGAGAQIYMALQPRLSETPVTSGSGSNQSINIFGLYGYKKLSEKMKLLLSLDFEQYATNFTGTGSRVESATSSSKRLTTLTGGLYYLF